MLLGLGEDPTPTPLGAMPNPPIFQNRDLEPKALLSPSVCFPILKGGPMTTSLPGLF